MIFLLVFLGIFVEIDRARGLTYRPSKLFHTTGTPWASRSRPDPSQGFRKFVNVYEFIIVLMVTAH